MCQSACSSLTRVPKIRLNLAFFNRFMSLASPTNQIGRNMNRRGTSSRALLTGTRTPRSGPGRISAPKSCLTGTAASSAWRSRPRMFMLCCLPNIAHVVWCRELCTWCMMRVGLLFVYATSHNTCACGYACFVSSVTSSGVFHDVCLYSLSYSYILCVPSRNVRLANSLL